jgi:tetratricopeptide (TPR) repeat protein
VNLALAAGALLAVAAAGYHNSFGIPLLFDDLRAILGNPSIRQLVPLGPVLAPPPSSLLGSRPLSNLTFALNYAWGGTTVTGYHALNLAFHVGAGLFLFGILRRTLARSRGPEGPLIPPSIALPFAATVTAVWLVHPLLTASVSYISQRTEVLMGLCYLGTLYAFVRGTEPAGRGGWLAVSVGLCALGALAKEVIVTAPFAVLLYDRTFVAGTFRAALRQRLPYYAALAASWLLLAAVMQRGLDPDVGPGRGVSAWSYALTQCGAIATYLGRLLWPYPLIFDYGEQYLPGVTAALPFVWAPLLLVGGGILALQRRSPAGFALGWILLTLAPTSSVIPITLQPIAENRAYLPAAGALSLLLVALYRIIGPRARAVAGAVALAGMVHTAARNATMGSAVALWTDTTQKKPQNHRAHHNLGFALFEAGHLRKAELAYLESLRLKPTVATTHANLAITFIRQGRMAEAIEAATAALKLDPNHVNAHCQLGVALLSSGRSDEGIKHLEQALRIDPGHVDSHHNLALALTYHGRPREALEHFAFVFRDGPGNARLRFQYGNALLATADRNAALVQYQLSLALDPNQPDVQQALARLGAATGAK